MAWLGVVLRVGILWLLSLVVAFAGLQLAHRMVIATERRTTALARQRKPSTVPCTISTAQGVLSDRVIEER